MRLGRQQPPESHDILPDFSMTHVMSKIAGANSHVIGTAGERNF
jgi:hypothetical protein